MHVYTLHRWQHGHRFASVDSSNERRTSLVVGLTAVTMVVEIAAGILYGSMALLVDGWHMGTHVAALGISVFAYRYARGHAGDRRYTFGTGKVGVLGGFASAVALAVVALLMGVESVGRFFSPRAIQFNQAIFVAVIGLLVNLLSAWLLRGHHGRESPGHEGSSHHHDHNLRAAYLHVLADTFTSILAIAALVAGKFVGLVWLDPLTGMVGGGLIAWWAYGLLRDTGHILLDSGVDPRIVSSVRSAIESDLDNRVSDLHVWHVGPNKFGAIISVVTHHPRPPEHYKALLSRHVELAHVTVEVHHCTEEPCLVAQQVSAGVGS